MKQAVVLAILASLAHVRAAAFPQPNVSNFVFRYAVLSFTKVPPY